ncbi:hypothetical protein SHKM778_09810 [Streptomyces sp. KM77-8]|uniref:SSD domain-containing protein n=1 Tax=Streptomyces haneummycinicus TaxID=3074435 RepID=A0AAT9HBA9_9ACTN
MEIGGSALESEVALGGTTEIIGVLVAAVVLVLTLGSLVAAGLPLLTAFVGVAIGFSLIAALAGPLGLTSTVSILALMLGLAVGIDYALFITSRFRDERALGREPEEAAGRAVGTAGSAVVFAGATVFIALVGLGVVGIPELTRMGLAGAGAVAIAVLVALTLVPALFGVFGRRVLSRAARRAEGAAARSAGGARARTVGGRPYDVPSGRVGPPAALAASTGPADPAGSTVPTGTSVTAGTPEPAAAEVPTGAARSAGSAAPAGTNTPSLQPGRKPSAPAGPASCCAAR